MCQISFMQAGGGVPWTLSANESTIAAQYNVFQQKHADDTVTYGLVGDTGVTRGWQEPDPVFPRSRASAGADSALALTWSV